MPIADKPLRDLQLDDLSPAAQMRLAIVAAANEERDYMGAIGANMLAAATGTTHPVAAVAMLEHAAGARDRVHPHVLGELYIEFTKAYPDDPTSEVHNTLDRMLTDSAGRLTPDADIPTTAADIRDFLKMNPLTQLSATG